VNILTLLRIGWLNMKRDRVVQALTFLLPIIFFSIFASVFGNQRNAATRRTRVAVVDEDKSPFSMRLVKALSDEGALRVRTEKDEEKPGTPLDRASAEQLIKSAELPVAIVLPKGIGAAPRFWNDSGAAAPKVLILADVSDPIAPQLVQGLLQKVSFTAAPASMAVEGIGLFEKYTGPLTPAQRQAFDQWATELNSASAAPSSAGGGSSAPIGLATELVNVMQPGRGDTATVSFYAAGIGVMFLLFSCAGAGGAFLEEEEAGTLGRLIGSRAGMGGVLLGKWLFIAIMGTLQMCVMFLWGAAVFGLPLAGHIPGFLVMTIITAAAAAGFGLVLATVSRSRAQLSGMSTIVILTMSAVGGSMFPRFLMSETMQQYGLITFNAWALDGYLKVFWRDAPLIALWPQVAVLGGLTIAFLLAARFFARRWETL